MSAFTLEETLEADWVAVRPQSFQEREKHKFVFTMAWNKIEGKFTITCHNCMAQHQRSGSRELYRCDPKARTSPKASIPMVNRGPAWGTGSSLARGFLNFLTEIGLWDSKQGAAAEALPKSLLRTKSSPSQRSLRGPEAECVTEEIEALELGKEEAVSLLLPPSPLQAAELAAPNMEPMGEECTWAGLFSFQDLRAVHYQLCSVNSDLEPYLPAFLEEPSGVWAVVFRALELSEQEMDALCYKLQVYLLRSLDTCGWKILSQVLFTETDDPEEYYESLSELRQKGYEEVLQRARRQIRELLERHKNMESMVELLELYQMEDEAYSSLAEATMELYQYLLQPFQDMKELAMLRRQQIKISVDNDYLGPRRIESLQKEYADWQRKAHMAVLSIQDLTVKYFEITAKAQKAVYDQM